MVSQPELKAKARFKRRVDEWAERVSVQPGEIVVRQMTRKWASCSSRKRLTFASDLVSQPRAFQDFVIVHELLHLRVPNHGKLFQALLGLYLPGWRAQERRYGQRGALRRNRSHRC